MPKIIIYSWKRFFIYWSIGLVLLALVASYFYIDVYDKSKGGYFSVKVDQQTCLALADRLPTVNAAQNSEITYHKGLVKAIMVISIKPLTGPVDLQSKDAPRHLAAFGEYHKFDTVPPTQALFFDWYYTTIIDSWGWIGGTSDYNRYAVLYGEEAAAGKPNYRYNMCVIFAKGASEYSCDIYCNNPNHLDELLTAFTDEVVKMCKT